jgi:hypothetical protein
MNGDVRYELRLYDEVLMVFSLEDLGISGLRAVIHEYDAAKLQVMPIGVKCDDAQTLVDFIRSRLIPKNRAFVHQILGSLGLSINDTVGILNVCRGLSLNDSYWIVPEGFDGVFAEYNLYENHVSDVLAFVALTGEISPADSEYAKLELTTSGNLPKAWRYIDGEGISLCKGSDSGREPYSEYYAAQVARRMGLDALDYGLEEYKGVLVSKCRLFTDIDTSYVPVGRIMRGRSIAAALDYYRGLGVEYYESLRSMLAFDCVVSNIDRHFGNFGLMRDNRTGEFLRAAPIYDNGLALYASVRNIRPDSLAEYENALTPYEISFEVLAREVVGDAQREQLARLDGFTFERHPSFNVPGELLAAMERRVRERAEKFCKGPL